MNAVRRLWLRAVVIPMAMNSRKSADHCHLQSVQGLAVGEDLRSAGLRAVHARMFLRQMGGCGRGCGQGCWLYRPALPQGKVLVRGVVIKRRAA